MPKTADALGKREVRLLPRRTCSLGCPRGLLQRARKKRLFTHNHSARRRLLSTSSRFLRIFAGSLTPESGSRGSQFLRHPLGESRLMPVCVHLIGPAERADSLAPPQPTVRETGTLTPANPAYRDQNRPKSQRSPKRVGLIRHHAARAAVPARRQDRLCFSNREDRAGPPHNVAQTGTRRSRTWTLPSG